jgi:flagellar hook-length control protein FliK
VAPTATPIQSTLVTPQSQTVPTVVVAPPQKGTRTEPSVDRVNHASEARVAAPTQPPAAAAAPRMVNDADIAPVIAPAPLVPPDAQIDAPQRVSEPAPSTGTTAFSPVSIPQVTPGAQAAQAVAPALAQAPLQTMVPTTEDGAPVMPRLVEMMRWQAQEGGGQAELRLRPEFLGAITVSIVVERGAVKAIVSAETPAALEYLRADMSSLQEALEERGLTLDEFEVREEVPRAERRRDPEDAPPRRDTVPPAPHRRARDEDGGAVFNVLM